MEKYQGKILLQGFDKAETQIIDKILKKFDTRLGRLNYKEIRLTLQRHRKGNREKGFLNEVQGLMRLDRNLLHAEITSHEFYPAITKVLEKLEQEGEHIVKLELRKKGKEIRSKRRKKR